jgi:CheY-like chemotaxis protein
MAIQGRASLVIKDLQPSHPFYDHLSQILQTVHKGTVFTSQLIGYARAGKYQVAPTDINALVLSCVKKIPLSDRGILGQTNLGGTKLFCNVDKRQMRLVLMNVLENAVTAMPDGGELTISTASESILEDSAQRHDLIPGQFVRITITDTGLGMDEATLHKVFDPFFTTETRTGAQGRGLGLAACHGIILNHKGAIDVWSTQYEGTSFTILLPQFEEPEDFDLEEGIRDLPMGFETILFVDDDELILEMGRHMLEDLGYRVITSNSGANAIEIYTSGEDFDLVVLDMIMDDMDGPEPFRRLQAIDPDVKVLISTGHTIGTPAEIMLASGCRGFILKPFTMAAFSRKLREILDPG